MTRGEAFLPRDEVHVWLADVGAVAAAGAALLSREERERSRQFRSARDRDRFVAARATLRQILARYCGQRPESLRFERSRLGKLRLVHPWAGESGLEFNLSHAGDLAAYAIAAGRRVGVDVEAIEPVGDDDDRLSRAWLSARELADLERMDPDRRTRAFYAAWTHKEAYLKARGIGFSESPARWRARFDAASGSAVARRPLGLSVAARWRILDLAVRPGFAGALAAEGHRWRLRVWTLSDHGETCGRAALAAERH